MWLPVLNYEGRYEVNELGEVKSVARSVTGWDGRTTPIKERILKNVSDNKGYQIVNLSIDGKQRNRKVHQLVLEAFVGPCPENMECCHNDGNPKNNELSNLQWNTKSHNQLDCIRHGTNYHSRKTHCDAGHELIESNLIKRKNRKVRECLQCNRDRKKR